MGSCLKHSMVTFVSVLCQHIQNIANRSTGSPNFLSNHHRNIDPKDELRTFQMFPIYVEAGAILRHKVWTIYNRLTQTDAVQDQSDTSVRECVAKKELFNPRQEY